MNDFSKENGQLKRKKKDKGCQRICLDQILSPVDDLSWVMCFVYGWAHFFIQVKLWVCLGLIMLGFPFINFGFFKKPFWLNNNNNNNQ